MPFQLRIFSKSLLTFSRHCYIRLRVFLPVYLPMLGLLTCQSFISSSVGSNPFSGGCPASKFYAPGIFLAVTS